MGRLGMWELVLILVIALIVFGPQKLPEMGRAVGRAMREFKKATRELTDELQTVQADLEKEVEGRKEAKAQDTQEAKAQDRQEDPKPQDKQEG